MHDAATAECVRGVVNMSWGKKNAGEPGKLYDAYVGGKGVEHNRSLLRLGFSPLVQKGTS